ncbi:hypothetical protein D9Q98_007526 [Chlorella vulgaris]|uniref:Endonuclease n=1 Tax=Chlorella vulgaris TaxID=3077 RepID=A0A9D4TLH2_CHLVU|nr:hypothetical protein D9Q98_007526 [Chlorella vulgaris]
MAARHIMLGTVVGMGLGGAAAFLYVRRQQQPAARLPDGTEIRHQVFKHGMPVGDRLRVFTDYASSFDTRLRNPRWVLEHIDADKVASREGSRKGSGFVEDKGIERRFRSTLDHFRNSGYDRGHMAPAANHKRSQEAMDQTFILSNTSPQVGAGFNRDYWARFERFVQDLSRRCDDVWVVTGPLYLPQPAPGGAPGTYVMNHPMIGTPPQLMAVPTHFFKVVLGEFSGGRRAAVGAFVMPNAAIHPQVPLASFTVPISALEEVAGLRFFPGYLSDTRREAIDETALAVQRVGHAELQLLNPGHQPLLLPLPANSAQAVPAAAAGAVAAAALGGSLAVQPTDQRRSLGAVHVCEHTECRLSAEQLWENGGRPGSRKGKGELQRTKSAPP